MNKISTKYIILLLFFISVYGNVSGQMASGIPHGFSVTAGIVPFPATGLTNVILASPPRAAIVPDEWDSLIAPAGWSFTFANIVYTKAVLSTNGWVALMPAAVVAIPPSIASPMPNNQLSNNTTGYPIIAPLWDDLSTSAISYAVNANALWIRWSCKWDKNNGTVSALVYLKLDGTNNTITFYYSNNTTYVPTNASASIGIAGVCTGDYYSVSCQSAGAATVDSTAENTSIGSGASPNARPYNVTYTFTPITGNDICTSGRVAGTITNTCTNFPASTYNAAVSGSGNCSTTDDNDVWFKFVKPLGVTNIKVTTSPATCQSVSGTSVEVYAVCGGPVLACASTSTLNPNYGEVSVSRPCAADTLYVRVTADGDIPGRFLICAKDIGVSPTTGNTCANSTAICAIPYSQTGLTTAGFGNEYDSANSACHDPFMNGEDYIFSYTPPANICIRVSVNSTGINPGVFIFDGCPNILATTHCIASAITTTGNMTINSVSLIAGTTYYFVVDNDTLGSAPPNIPFDINITSLGAGGPATDACGAVNLGSIPNSLSCVFTGYTTECSTPSATAYPAPGCAPYTNGITGDIWLSFTAGYTGAMLLRTQPGSAPSATDLAMAVYQGNCAAMTLFACDDNSAGSNMPLLSIPVINGTNYFIRIWTVAPGSPGNFNFCISSACSPPNDLPCQAVLVNLGGTANGFNTCAGSGGEPLNAAQCVMGGIINTVWYKAVVPASGSLKVRTHTHTLTDTQIEAFRFPTGCVNASSNSQTRGCNDDGPDCGSQGGQSWHDFSELTIVGQIPGDTIFIAVDGFNSQTGSFDITIIDGSLASFPPVYGADCDNPVDVCGPTSITVPDPGILGYGNICDFQNNYNCWANGERNSAWYRVTVNPGVLQFDVQTFSDYDFIMWDITNVASPCSLITNSPGSLTSVRCNWVTTVGGHTGISIPDPDGSWEPAVTIPAGPPHTFLILIDNWNPPFQTTGFTLDWMGSPIAAQTTSVTWQGSVDTLFSSANNWGTPPCNAMPTCAIDATIAAAPSGFNPTINANMSVKNLVINSGATLRIKSPFILDVCGNFTNNGTFIAEPGSTVRFSGTGTQLVTGSLTGTNSFANLTILKASGAVQLNSNIDVAENFLVSNATSIFNINGKYMKVGKNFTNWNGPTFIGIVGSTVEFNGTINQNYANTNGQDTLNRVMINKTAGNVYLTGASSNMIIDSVLTLLSGNIVTTPTLEVYVRYGAAAAIVSHSANSYIDGRLRRKLFFGSIDWPVGDSLVPNQGAGKGYELANINFTTSTVVPDLLAWFSIWPGAVPNGPGAFDFCLAVPSSASYTTQWNLPLLDHGYWTFQRTAPNFNGAYNVTLSNTGGTNAAGTMWTVAYAAIAAAPLNPASWGLFGICTLPSTMALDKRNQFNVPASAANSFNHLYAAAQATLILPVELLYFTAEPKGEEVLCKWETASETNNDYFDVERSENGYEYHSIGRVKGFGAGICTENRSYSIIDHDLCEDVRYYRLKQVDIDGQYSYSDPVAINCKRSSGIELYPNPANSTLTFQFSQPEDCELIISMVDMAGRIVYTENFSGLKGINTVTSKIDELAAGAYYLRISAVDKRNVALQAHFFKN